MLPDDPEGEFRVLRVFHDTIVQGEGVAGAPVGEPALYLCPLSLLPRYGVVKPPKNDQMTLCVETPFRFSGHPCFAVSSR